MTGRIVPPHASGMKDAPKTPHIFRRTDPDETEGRRMYRARADAQARLELALDKHIVRLRKAGPQLPKQVHP